MSLEQAGGTKKARIIQRLLSGDRPQQIVTDENCSVGYVNNVKCQARKQGIIFNTPPHPTQETHPSGTTEEPAKPPSLTQSSPDKSQNTVEVSTTPELVPYENCLRQLTERENVMTRKVGLLKAIDMKMDSISALRTIEKEHGLRVLARRMHEDRTLYNKVMWQLYNERSDIGGAVNELALKLSWGLKWKEKLDAILNERFNLASYLMTNFATNSEKATGKRLELVIEPFFALDEWGAILQDLRVEAQTMEDLYTQNVCTTNS